MLSDQSQQDVGPFSPVTSKKGFGIGSVFLKAASVASVAAKHAFAAASSSVSSDDEMLPLKCCLMSISLPWEYIVYDLLFKVKSLFLLLYSSMKIGSILDCGIVLLFTRSFFISIIFLILLLAVPIGKLKLSVAILGYEHYLSMFILLLGAGTDFLTCTKRVLIHLIIAISGKSSKYTTLSFVKIYKGPSDRLQVEIKCGINNFRMISFSGTCNLSCG
jgi:hypothetical protein